MRTLTIETKCDSCDVFLVKATAVGTVEAFLWAQKETDKKLKAMKVKIAGAADYCENCAKSKRSPVLNKHPLEDRAQEVLTIKHEGKEVRMLRGRYVNAKTRSLREFGYSNLTETHVSKQLDLVLLGKTLSNGLDVIGAFMKDEIVSSNPMPRKP